MQPASADGTVHLVADEKLSTVVSARFTPGEAQQLRDQAGGRPLAQVLRELALDHLRGKKSSSAPPAVSVGLMGSVAATGRCVRIESNYQQLTAPGLRRSGWLGVTRPSPTGAVVGR